MGRVQWQEREDHFTQLLAPSGQLGNPSWVIQLDGRIEIDLEAAEIKLGEELSNHPHLLVTGVGYKGINPHRSEQIKACRP
jgi:hypothetical protein